MEELVDLYKRAANGAIRHWTIEVDGNRITRKSGILNGSYTPTVNVITEGKNLGRSNETTPEEQAELEAKSYWKKQLDLGYKSLEMLGWNGEELPIEPWLQINLPKYNTDAQGRTKPMLAQKAKPKSTPFPVFLDPKYDGVRCLMFIDNSEILFFSRAGKQYHTLQHIADSIPKDLGTMILDGEVYSHEISFQNLGSAVKKLGPDSYKLAFRAYDIVDMEKDQTERTALLKDIVHKIDSALVIMTPRHTVDSWDEVKWNHDQWVNDGYEGAMIRYRDGMYECGVRSKYLRKVKEFDEQEFKIVGGKVDKVLIKSGTTFDGDKSVIDSFTFVCVTAEGKTFDPKPMGSRAQRLEYMNNLDKLKGEMLTVKFFGWTDDTKPRFPIGKIVRDYE